MMLAAYASTYLEVDCLNFWVILPVNLINIKIIDYLFKKNLDIIMQFSLTRLKRLDNAATSTDYFVRPISSLSERYPRRNDKMKYH